MKLQGSPVRLWCLECQSLATDDRCVGEHSFCSVERVLNQAVQDVGVMLQALTVDLQGAQQSLQIMRDCSNAAVARQDPTALRACAASADRMWDAVHDALRRFGEEARQCQEAESQAAVQLLDEAGWKAPQGALGLPDLLVVESTSMALATKRGEINLGESVSWLSTELKDELKDERAVALACLRRQGVRRIAGLLCKRQPAWVLDVLRCAAPTLEELELVFPKEEHIQAAHCLPGLRRLCLFVPVFEGTGIVLPGLSRPGSLQWLKIHGYRVPWSTLLSLLKAHRVTLDVLWLTVSPESDGQEWPPGCSGLDGVLDQCSLRLSRIVLLRDWSHCSSTACSAQVSAVRRVLPNAIVECGQCEQVLQEAF